MHGWHRALAMRSRVNRGTPECPGLVFALVPGGSCRGRAYRIEQRTGRGGAAAALGARDADRRLRPEVARLPHAAGRACARSPSRSAGAARATPAPFADGELVEILRTANGRYGSTLAYLVETARSLRTCGIRDRDVERLVALARRHALTAGYATAARAARPPRVAPPATRATPRRRHRDRPRCRCRPGCRDRRARPRTPDSGR